MTENNSPDEVPTSVGQPVAAAPLVPPGYAVVQTAAPTPAKTSHLRTILEVVAAVVAVGLILCAGAAGFVIGHLTARNHDGPHGRMMVHITRPWGNQGFGDGPGLPRWGTQGERPDIPGSGERGLTPLSPPQLPPGSTP